MYRRLVLGIEVSLDSKLLTATFPEFLNKVKSLNYPSTQEKLRMLISALFFIVRTMIN